MNGSLSTALLEESGCLDMIYLLAQLQNTHQAM